MSYALDPVVPDALRSALAEELSCNDGFTVLVLTPAGEWPHLSMVSQGELVVVSQGRLLLALWPTSTTCANLESAGIATLCFVIDGVSYSLRTRGVRLPDITTPRAGTVACFLLSIEAAFGDTAPYAEIETGVRFRLTDPSQTVQRWAEVRAELDERSKAL